MIDVMFNKIIKIPIIDFIEFYYKIYNFNKEIVANMCEKIKIQLIDCIQNYKNKNLVFVATTYLLLKIFEDELMYNFTPHESNTESTQSDSTKHNETIHSLLCGIIQKFKHEDIANFIITASQVKIPDKITKESKILAISLKNINRYYETNAVMETIRYIAYNIKNKDDFEEIYSKVLCRKILDNSIKNFDMESIESNICQISNIDTMCLQKNRKIIRSFCSSNHLSNEYNILFENESKCKTNTQNKDLLNLLLFPDAISPVQTFEYKEKTYLSKTFKDYLKLKKRNFNAYYVSKYDDSKKINWAEHLCTFDLTYKIDNINIDFRVNYKQADVLFLIQEEYYTLFSKIKSENSQTIVKENNPILLEFIEIDYKIKQNAFIKLLLEKKVFKLEQNQINHLIKIDLVIFNNKMNVLRNKKFDFYKLKLDKSDESVSKINKPKGGDNLIFFRSDYIQCAIMKICKQQREIFISEDNLFNQVNERVKNRFELEKSVYAKSLEKLVNQEYIDKHVDSIDNKFKYKYLP